MQAPDRRAHSLAAREIGERGVEVSRCPPSAGAHWSVA